MIDLRWAAGFFDGEGSVRIGKATNQNLGALDVAISQVDRDLLVPFAERWGGRIRAVSGLRPGQRPASVWVVYANAALAFLTDIEPYVMSERNRQRIALAREFQEGAVKSSSLADDEYRNWRFGCYLRMKTLNRRGTNRSQP